MWLHSRLGDYLSVSVTLFLKLSFESFCWTLGALVWKRWGSVRCWQGQISFEHWRCQELNACVCHHVQHNGERRMLHNKQEDGNMYALSSWEDGQSNSWLQDHCMLSNCWVSAQMKNNWKTMLPIWSSSGLIFVTWWPHEAATSSDESSGSKPHWDEVENEKVAIMGQQVSPSQFSKHFCSMQSYLLKPLSFAHKTIKNWQLWR